MKKKIAAVVLAFAALFGAGAAATPAYAGNGTSNYYLTGSCKAGSIGGVYMNATNWDYGANQYYHVSITRSGVAYTLDGFYKDGVYYGKSLGEYQPWDGGHGRSYLFIRAHDTLGTKWTCGFYL